jgi:glycyl-tRNA synthetase alpha chain
MYLQGVDSVFDLEWAHGITYGELHKRTEYEGSVYNFELADTDMLFRLFEMFEREAERILDAGLVFPAFEYTLKCSHTFNLLDSRGALSVMERTRYIKRVQRLARRCATAYLNLEGSSPFPASNEMEG